MFQRVYQRFDVLLGARAPAKPPFQSAHDIVRNTGNRDHHHRLKIDEDEERVRRLTNQVLSHLGYRVTAAVDAARACELVEGTGQRYDLLLTDVVMPDMKGPDLYERLQKTQRNLKCLFMSGYAENFIVHHGVADPGRRLLQKPFSTEVLARSVRKALDGKR